MNHQRFAAALLMLALRFSVPNCSAGLLLLPEKITLDGPAAEQRLVVENADGKIWLGQVTNEVAFTSSNPQVVRVENGVALAVGNGTATITAKAGRNSAKADVRVVNFEKQIGRAHV